MSSLLVRRLVLLLLLLLLGASQLQRADALKIRKESADAEGKDVHGAGLDKVEKFISASTNFLSKHKWIPNVMASAALLSFGGKIGNTVLLLQAVRSTSMPLIASSVEDLKETYSRTRLALKAEMPTLMQAKKELPELTARVTKLKKEAEEVQKLLEGGSTRVSEEEVVRKLAAAKEAAEDLRVVKKKLDAVSNSFKTILAALSPEHLASLAKSLYLALVTSAAVASSSTAKAVTLGLSFGQHIVSTAKGLLSSHAHIFDASMHSAMAGVGVDNETAGTWVNGALKTVAHGVGIALAFAFQRVALTYSACLMGAELLITSCHEHLDPVLAKLQLPTAADNKPLVSTIKNALVVFAAVTQLKGGRGNFLTDFLLKPLFMLEKVITATFFNKNVSA